MPNGTVKFFNAAKKFGFITPDEGGKDVFVPVASVAAAGISALRAGQRVSFETTPDGKGPKVVNLVLIDVPPSSPSAAKLLTLPSNEEGRAQLTFYCDPACETSRKALAEIRAAGGEPRVVDYIATPPGRDELKRLSMLLLDGDGSLVRRYDPLFRDLRLDDRFISQDDFWDAIVENPTLINGPVIATARGASICRSENAIRSFLGVSSPDRTQADVEQKAVAACAVAAATDARVAQPRSWAAEVEGSEISSAKIAAPNAGASVKNKAKSAPKGKSTLKNEPKEMKPIKNARQQSGRKSERVPAK
jgi:arsenate reductase (glutaredoxin)